MPTQAEILTDIRSRLDEATGRQWSNEELRRWINDGLRDISRRAEVLQSVVSIGVLTNIQEYELPGNVVRVHRVEWRPDGEQRVIPLTYQDFHNMDQVWVSSQEISVGDPLFYTMWGYPPNLKVVLYPKPSRNGALKVFFYAMADQLAVDGSDADKEINLPSGWSDLVSLYCEYVALRKDADPRWQEAKALYEETLGDMLDLTRRWTDQAGAVATETSLVPRWLYDPW
jgi:hypothetical protein